MTRVLVTGGTGYVGRFIVEHLLAHGYRVTVCGRTAPAAGFYSSDVAFVPLALDPGLDRRQAFDDIDCCVHAAFSHVPGRYRGGEGDDPAGFLRANLDGSVHLFEAARSAGARRCVFLSSRAVYGPQPPGTPLTEETPARPDTLYGEMKLNVERSLMALSAHDFVAASLRVTGVYGPAGPGREHKWRRLFSDYRAGRPVPVRAGTEVHGDDVGAAVRLMLEGDAGRINGQVFNVSDLLVDTREILSVLKDATGCPHPLPQAADVGTFNTMATAKIGMLGWTPGGMQRLQDTIATLA